ncbi:IS1/IS1595 family N-terminal zinc-binding domain-containing protein [Spiroplasma endosymbiont of 'Nebria riversi']
MKFPKCESYHCVKNGHNSEGKQKYLYKNCRASFDAKFIDSNFIARAI